MAILLGVQARSDRVTSTSFSLSQPPLTLFEFLLAFLPAHLLNWLPWLVAPGVELTHVFDTKSIDFFHPSHESCVSLPPVLAAFPSYGLLFAIDGFLDTFLYTAVENPFALLLLFLLTVRLVEASAVDIGLPEQLAEADVSEINPFFGSEIRPFIRIVAVD